ncbi:hypothetical protein K435DRAFT_694744, partial [Dendrothele bispora CBS 962.96]
ISRCFPHVVNISCQAVIETAENGACEDAISRVRGGIREIRKSGIRRDAFTKAVIITHQKPLQLLRDVKTRWSSFQLMLRRADLLSKNMHDFLSDSAYGDLSEFILSDDDWRILRQLMRVLAIPHAYQQLLSKEKTPTLCDALPSFVEMIRLWEDLKYQLPEMIDPINAGLAKLKDYQSRMAKIPAYTYSMCKSVLSLFSILCMVTHVLCSGQSRYEV